MMQAVVAEVAAAHGASGDVIIEISVDDGEALAARTWNPRLGILGGLSILGTTGVVVPFSCSAWIHSIHRGIDVARATGISHAAACTGSTSEAAVQRLYGLPESALLDMGDFAGGLLKYLRRHPLPRLTLGGGFGKLCKLAAGHLDLHSGRSQVDLDLLAGMLEELGAAPELAAQARQANTAKQVLDLAEGAGLPLADAVAAQARRIALDQLAGETAVEVLIFDRAGNLAGKAAGWPP
jgi:cobalt-precorrin-5B (C1)-methyltransferase